MDTSGDAGDTTVVEETSAGVRIFFKTDQFSFKCILFDKTTQTVSTQPSKLDKETQDLIRLIYDKDMFKDAMKRFDIGI